MIGLALFAAVAFIGGMVLERLLLRWRFEPWFSAGFPLHPELVPIPKPPKRESGRTATVHWERREDVVLFWSEPGEKAAPNGLHGAVRLVPGARGVQLLVRWSPPWSPMLAGAWLAGLGIARGEGLLMVPIGTALIMLIVYVYRMAAVRAAAELRWSFVSGLDDEG